jgi:hypothetical protein
LLLLLFYYYRTYILRKEDAALERAEKDYCETKSVEFINKDYRLAAQDALDWWEEHSSEYILIDEELEYKKGKTKIKFIFTRR